MSHRSVRLLVEHTVKALTDNVQYSYGEESDFDQTKKHNFLMVNTQLMPASAVYAVDNVFNYSKTWVIKTAFYKFDSQDSIDYYRIHDEIDPICDRFVNKINERDDLVILSSSQEPFVKALSDILTGYLVTITVRLEDSFDYCYDCVEPAAVPVVPVVSSLLTGLAAYYKLDELSGSVLNATGGLSGTNDGATPGVAGVFNTAYSFDGINDTINLGAVLNSPSFSYWGWINTTNAATQQGIFYGGAPGCPAVRLDASGKVVFNKSFTATIVASFNMVPSNTWVHIAVTYDGVTGVKKVYINGVDDTDPFYSPSIVAFNFGNSYIGSESGSPWFTGIIDEVGMSTRAITLAEVNEAKDKTYPFT